MGVFRFLLLCALLAVLAVAGVYLAAPASFVRGVMQMERWVAGVQRESVSIPDFEVVYLDSGGAGEPLLLLHGFGGDKDHWTRIAQPLRQRYRVIAPDLPGYGETGGALDAGYGIAAQVQRVHAFVQALGLTRVHVGGSSMGGNIAANYAIAHPNQVGSLWLVANSGVATAPMSEVRRKIAAGEANPLVPRSAEEFRQMLGVVMTRVPVVPQPVVDVLAQRAAEARELRARQFADLMAENLALEGRIDGLPVPTHIVWGQQDRVLHVGAVDVLASRLPQASQTVLPDIGHLPMIEAPETVAADYLAFRKRIAAAPRAAP